MTAADTEQALRTLVARIEAGKELVLLAGAGISVTAGVRTGEQLAEQLKREQPSAFPAGARLGYAQTLRAALPTPEDRRARIEAECLGCPPTLEHHWIAAFMARRRLRAVITTNFDHLIEYALIQIGAEGIPVVLADDEFHPGGRPSKTPPLVKMHGDFLFNDLANLEEELQNKLRETMRHALLALTADADILVVGFSGSDLTVVSLIGELVRSRSPEKTRVWWSRFQNHVPSAASPLGQLVESASRAGNPLTWLGPWGAAECLRALGEALGVPAPKPTPFGITSAGITMPTHFSCERQRLAGSAETRSGALKAHPRLAELVDQGGVALLCQEPGSGGSTLLAATAEAAGPRGLYFDHEFAQRPPHLDLRNHLAGLAWQIGVQDDPRELFRQNAVVVIDGLEKRTTGSAAYFDASFLTIVVALAEAQRVVGHGVLLLGTHLSTDQLLRPERDWLPAEDRVYRLTARRPLTASAPPIETETLLEALSLVGTAIPQEAAVRAAALPSEPDWEALDYWVDRRGDRVALHAAAFLERCGRISGAGAMPRALADALRDYLETVHPLRTAGIALEAEALYYDADHDDPSALRMFLQIAESGTSNPTVADYFWATFADYLTKALLNPDAWRALSTGDGLTVGRLLARSALRDELRSLAFTALLRGRDYVEAECIMLPERMKMVYQGSAAEVARQVRELARRLEDTWSRARGSKTYEAGRARLALSLSALWLTAGDLDSDRECYTRAITWSRSAQSDAKEAGESGTAGLASDNEACALLKVDRLEEAHNAIQKRLDEVGRDQGFSEGKAVTLGNLFHLYLRRREFDRAEVLFFETLFQNVLVQRWHGVYANLGLLHQFALVHSELPSASLVEAAMAKLRQSRSVLPL